MIIRTAVCAAVAVALSASAVIAQSKAIAERKEIMKGVGAAAKEGAAMARGSAPYDNAKAVQVFVVYANAAAKMPGLFPEDSKTGGETTAAPKIWEDMAGFKAAFAKMEADSKAAQSSVKDLDSFKTAFGAMGKQCGACHEVYRIKK
jgi:cytochrome c556